MMEMANSKERGHVLGRFLDIFCFCFLPLFSFLILFSHFKETRLPLLLGLDMAHQLSSFFRTHFNRDIFRQYRARFVYVPILLFLSLFTVPGMFNTAQLVRFLWDPYHSAMQIFGLARIVERKAGNNPAFGRKMDMIYFTTLFFLPILNFSLTRSMPALPIPGLAPLSSSVAGSFSGLEKDFLSFLLYMIGLLTVLGQAIYYFWAHKKGLYRFSQKKTMMNLIALFYFLFIWGFTSLNQVATAFSLIHSVQYVFMVWKTEGENLKNRFSCRMAGKGKFMAFGAFGLALFLYANLQFISNQVVHCLVLTVNLLHFWYDGFIWPVKKASS